MLVLDENIEKKLPYLKEKLLKHFTGSKPEEVEEAIEWLKKADPICVKSEGKKTPFVNQILNWFIAGKIRLPEDIETIRDTLVQYSKFHNKLKGIEHYHSPGELRKALQELGPENQGKQEYPGTVIDTIPGYKLIRIDNWEQGEVCFRDSGWCVQKPEYFENYEPPYFMVVKDGGSDGKDKRYALIHVGSEQIKDVHDDSLTPKLAKPIVKFLRELFSRELKHIETDPEALENILNAIGDGDGDGDGDNGNDLYHIIVELLPKEMFSSNPQLAVAYAEQNRVRVPELEPVIMKSPEYAYFYAKNILNKRWPEAEPIIMKSEWAVHYASTVIKGRWIEAEPYILKDPQEAVEYVKYVIKGRWIEAEPIMKTDPIVWKHYKSFLTFTTHHSLKEQLREIFSNYDT